MSSIDSNFRRRTIWDAISGEIGFNSIEADIIDTRCFQRLRNLKQLGVVPLVFPSINYTRFSHSLGVCDIVGKGLNRIKDNSTRLREIISDELIARYRLAGLLHDIGHYPYCHATQDAIVEYHEECNLGKRIINKHRSNSFLKHEDLGCYIIRNDSEIAAILHKANINPDEICSLIQCSSIDNLDIRSIISSDLDADRMDYLRRTAYHGNLPYGNIDVDFILSSIRCDDDGLKYDKRAIRTIEHMLISRCYEYMQIINNRTIVAFEQMQKYMIKTMIQESNLFNKPDIIKDIEESRWCIQTDCNLDKMLYEYNTNDKLFLELRERYFRRQPIKEVICIEQYALKPSDEYGQYITNRELVDKIIEDTMDYYGLEDNRFFKTELEPKTIATISNDDEKSKDIVRIENVDNNRVFSIDKYPGSIVSHLSNSGTYCYRVYLSLSEDERTLEEEVKIRINKLYSEKMI